MLAALTTTLHAQSLNVRGKITNAAGQAVNNAVVELVKRGLKDTTGSDGAYSIGGITALRHASRTQDMSLEQGVLRLSVVRPTAVKVEVFDLRGNQLRMEAMPDASEGEYRWDLAEHPLSEQMMIIKASIGREVRAFRYLPGTGGEGSRSAAGFTPAIAFLAKSAAAVDTIRVTAAGYATKLVSIDSYDTTADISLAAPNSGGEGRSAGCGKTSSLKTGKGLSFSPSGGQARTYNLRIPDDYDNSTAYRLVVAIHWLNGTANNVTDGNYYGLWPLANPTGSKSTTIFVAPQGIGNAWPGGNVPFITSLVDKIKSEFCIDTTRIFAEGFSMGGSMSYALACEAPDMFRAVAVHSGGPMSGCNKKNKPVAYFMTHGTRDGVCTYPGFGVPQINEFAKLNGCQAMDIPGTLKPTDGSGMNPSCADFQGCDQAYPTRACIFVGDHTPNPGGSKSWVPGETWKFLTRF
ncbi:MAG TPA: PHB depolymerase family esterase [Fibrobacteria bacterium]|nr:PHB depolymerase family esterase [Fibrobacteria bacterium]